LGTSPRRPGPRTSPVNQHFTGNELREKKRKREREGGREKEKKINENSR
jgi:hypothetical protein